MACRSVMSCLRRQALVPARRSLGGTPAGRVQTSAKKASGVEEMIQQKNAQNKVMIYSKTYCPYCSRAKTLFKDLQVDFKVAELDTIADGSEVQSTLQAMTGVRTVPQIFINGEFVGGCSDLYDLHDNKKLLPKLDAAGIKHA